MPCQMSEFSVLHISGENMSSSVFNSIFVTEVKAASFYLIGSLQFTRESSLVKSFWSLCRN